MPVFRPEEFVSSEVEKELLAKLKSEGKRGRIIAGGTGFYELARRGYIPEVKTIVSIMGLNLSYVRNTREHVAIGATTTLQSLLESQAVMEPGLEAIDDALKEIRPVQVRNVATVGGEICISVPIVDLPTALLACDASLRIVSEKDERTLRLDEFYIDAFLTKLRYGEFVKEIILPKPQNIEGKSSKRASAFLKFGRTAYDFNLINCAVMLSCELSTKKIQKIKISLGGIKRTPMRATEVEEKLENRRPEENRILESVQASFSKTNLLPSVHGSNEYKHELLPIIVRDCVMKAYDRSLQNN